MTPPSHILEISKGAPAHLAGIAALPLVLAEEGTFRVFHVDERETDVRERWVRLVAQLEGKPRSLVAREEDGPLIVDERNLPAGVRIVPADLYEQWTTEQS